MKIIQNGISTINSIIKTAIRKNEGSINIPKAIYVFTNNIANNRYNQIMKEGVKPSQLFSSDSLPDWDHGLILRDQKSITINGNGSKIVTRGILNPIFITGCNNIKLTNFEFELSTPNLSIGTIIKKRINSFDVQIDEIKNELEGDVDNIAELGINRFLNLNGGEWVSAWIDFNRKTKFLGQNEQYINRHIRLKSKNPTIITIPIKNPKHLSKLKVGAGIILRHLITHHPTIHIFNSRNIVLENMTVYSSYWGAIIGHRVHNLGVNNLQVRPAPNQIMSTIADATHFISCSGKVRFNNCYFEGHGDDALNIHTVYYVITKIQNEFTIEATIKIEQQDRIFDYPDPKDLVEFVKVSSLSPFAQGKLKDVKILQGHKKLMLYFEETIPKSVKIGDAIASTSKAAKLEFKKNKILNNRARGILIQTRDVLIEDNEIENCTGTGIYITCSPYWWEALSARDIIIRENMMKNCGGGPGTMVKTSGIAIKSEANKSPSDLFRNIIIQNNNIHSFDSKLDGIHIENASNVKIIQNNFVNLRANIKIKNTDMIEIKK